MQGGLCHRQTPGTGGFHHLHRVAKGVRDMRGAEGKPFLKGADEQSLMDTTIRTRHDTGEHTRSLLGERRPFKKSTLHTVSDVVRLGCDLRAPSVGRRFDH